MRVLATHLLLPSLWASTTYALPPRIWERAEVIDVADLKNIYDYVIIGGGTSGLTVADRLTKDLKSIAPEASSFST